MAMSTTGDLEWDETAYNRDVFFKFYENNVYDQAADVKPTNATHDGATTKFYKMDALTPTSTALDESTDVTPESLSTDSVLVSAYEYGKAVRTTALSRITSVVPVIPSVTYVLGKNSGESADYIAQGPLVGGSNVYYAGYPIGSGARNQLTPSKTLKGSDISLMKNRMRRASVPMPNGLYYFYLHPDALYDLQEDTGATGWTELSKYTTNVSAQFDIGVFKGFRFIETAHASVIANGGSSPATTDVYQSVALGYQGLAKTYSSQEGYGPNPITVMTPVTDNLRRFIGWGWKHFVGYARFREESIWRIESASSIGANAA